jgi:peptidoglycan/xylan/chitin deacetylase (PgdA/CDA1 family)
MIAPSADPAPAGARPWRPAPAIVASAAVHAGAAVALALAPAHWPAVAGAVLANHALLTAAGLWPRSRLLGPNLLRLPPAAVARREVALTVDDGPDPEVTPRVLDLLDRHGAKASFFCIGERARAYPELCREIVRRGHSVENHTQRHSHRFALLGMRGFEREIAAAQETLAQLAGQTPRFFRAPAGLRNPLLDPVLARLGLRLASWTRRGFDTVTRDPGKVARRLLRRLDAGDILLLHDGHAARTESGAAVVLEVLPCVLEALQVHGLHSVTLPTGTA